MITRQQDHNIPGCFGRQPHHIHQIIGHHRIDQRIQDLHRQFSETGDPFFKHCGCDVFPGQIVVKLLIGCFIQQCFFGPGGFLDIAIQRAENVELFLRKAVERFHRTLEVMELRYPFHHAVAVVPEGDKVVHLSVQGRRPTDCTDRIRLILAMHKVVIQSTFQLSIDPGVLLFQPLGIFQQLLQAGLIGRFGIFSRIGILQHFPQIVRDRQTLGFYC